MSVPQVSHYMILDMTQNGSDQDSLLCCRACLTTKGRFFNIHELADAFFSISGTSVDNPLFMDKLPRYLCSYCRALLLKYASFRDMCGRTQQWFLSELLKGELNAKNVGRINHPSRQSLNLTEVETIDFVPTEDGNIVGTTHNIKDEPNIDIVDINSILKNADDVVEIKKIDDIKLVTVDATNLKTELNIEHEIEFNYDIDTSSFDVNMAIDVDDDHKKHEDLLRLKTKINPKVTNGNNTLVLDVINIESGKKVTAKDKTKINKRDTKLVKEKRKMDAVKKVKWVKKKAKTEPVKKLTRREILRIKKEREEASRNEKLERAYGVKIVILSKEEQVADIAARKETRNYLESHYKCEECWKGFDAKAAFENHMLRHNPSTGAHVCDVCRTRFQSYKRLNNHLELHRVRMICNQCGFVSRTRSHAKDHHGLHAGRTFDCPHCGKGFQKRSSCLSHVRLLHPALNVACDVCGEMFVGDKGLKHHKAITHAQHIKCTTCSVKFVSLEALNRHMDTAGEHSDLRPCEQCGENCASEQALQDHVEEKHPRETHRCEECKMEFPSAAAYDIHHQRKHLNQKLRLKHNVPGSVAKRRAPAPRDDLPRGQFVCEQCGHVARSDILLRYHQRKHQTVKPFACNICPKTFDFKTTRDNHVRSHTGEKPFKCEKCPRAFNVKWNLYRHNKTAHLNIHERVPCPICSRELSSKGSLRLHVNTVHNGQPWPKRNRNKRAKNT